jgi:hypothetical protein
MTRFVFVLALLLTFSMSAQKKNNSKKDKNPKEVVQKKAGNKDSADWADEEEAKGNQANGHWRTSPNGESDILHQMALRKTDFLIEELRISREQDKEKIFWICKKQVQREQNIEREYGSGKEPSPAKKKAQEKSQQVFMKEVQEALSLADPQ